MSEMVVPPESPRPRNKKIILLILVMSMVLCAFLLWYFVLKPKQAQPEQFNPWREPVAVRVVPLTRADLVLELKAVGTALPTHSVTVQSQVTGILKALYFKDGQMVRKGQLLAQIDPASFQVALAEAEGTFQQQQAQLQHALAELKRLQDMRKADAIAQQQVDQQQATVNQLRGQSKAYQAAIDAAKLQLSYSKIYAPISGRAGFRQKDVGNLIQANDATGIVSIAQTTPIYVEFAIAENYLDVLRGANTQQLMVEAWDRQEQKQLATGEVFALDNQIDSTTGTLKIKAIFDNANGVLYPNQFVNVKLQAQTIHNAVTVPSDAIQHGAKGTYVYIVDDENKAQIRMLDLGMTSAGKTQVLAGLQGNEKVVLEGIDRLEAGRDVHIVADPQSQNDRAPTDVAPSSSASTSKAYTSNASAVKTATTAASTTQTSTTQASSIQASSIQASTTADSTTSAQ